MLQRAFLRFAGAAGNFIVASVELAIAGSVLLIETGKACYNAGRATRAFYEAHKTHKDKVCTTIRHATSRVVSAVRRTVFPDPWEGAWFQGVPFSPSIPSSMRLAPATIPVFPLLTGVKIAGVLPERATATPTKTFEVATQVERIARQSNVRMAPSLLGAIAAAMMAMGMGMTPARAVTANVEATPVVQTVEVIDVDAVEETPSEVVKETPSEEQPKPIEPSPILERVIEQRANLEAMTLRQLRKLAREKNIVNWGRMSKNQLVLKLMINS